MASRAPRPLDGAVGGGDVSDVVAARDPHFGEEMTAAIPWNAEGWLFAPWC